MPSNTGAPGGRRTGQQMTHYIVDGGPYDQAYNKLIAGGFAELLADIQRPTDRKKAESKTLSICPKCSGRGWSAPTQSLACGNCQMQLNCFVPMVPERKQS